MVQQYSLDTPVRIAIFKPAYGGDGEISICASFVSLYPPASCGTVLVAS
jgi:hypothetical protein